MNKATRKRLNDSFKRLEERGYIAKRSDFPTHPLGCNCPHIPSDMERYDGHKATYEKPKGN